MLPRENEGGKKSDTVCYTSLLMRVSRSVERDEVMCVNVFEKPRNSINFSLCSESYAPAGKLRPD